MANDNNNITPHLVHSHDIHLDDDYTQWLVELKNRYRSAQIKAAVKVNAEKLLFNWQLGRDLVQKKAEERWGTGVVEQVSLDLQREYPDEKGLSARNLWWMKQWYSFYTSLDGEKLNQLGAELKRIENQHKEKMNQLGSQIQEFSSTDEINGYPFPPAFGFVPWRHHVAIIQKCKSVSEALFYIHKTISEGWSRQTLENCIHAKLYHTCGGAITNFEEKLPYPHNELAQEITKENYDLGFISLPKNYQEPDLQAALEQYIADFLLELGTGFAFVGRQKELIISGKTRRIDLLFYHIHLRCYVVIELKAKPFEPEFASKLNFYVNAVDDILKTDSDNPTIGLLLCNGMDHTEVKYTFRGITSPLGVATYDNIHIKELTDQLPTPEQFRQRVRQLETELRLSRKLIHKLTEEPNP